jgi:DNA polymerase-3 subunit delta'
MCDFKEIIGQNKSLKILKNSIKNNNIYHSYLFTGQEGIGKKMSAIAFAKIVNCLNPDPHFNPCNQCKSCLKIDRKKSPDVKIIMPQKGSIKINQIREIKKEINFYPFENKKKIYIIDHADQMTIEASNSILKILEEPPEFVILILITAYPDLILPTIISRCNIIHFELISYANLKKIILAKSSVRDFNIEKICRISQGSPGKALYLIENEQYLKLIKSINDTLDKTSPVEFISLIQSAENLLESREKDLENLLETMLIWYRDILISKIDHCQHLVVNRDREKIIREYQKYYDFDKLIDIMDYFFGINEKLERNINPKLILENLWIKLGDISCQKL